MNLRNSAGAYCSEGNSKANFPSMSIRRVLDYVGQQKESQLVYEIAAT